MLRRKLKAAELKLSTMAAHPPCCADNAITGPVLDHMQVDTHNEEVQTDEVAHPIPHQAVGNPENTGAYLASCINISHAEVQTGRAATSELDVVALQEQLLAEQASKHSFSKQKKRSLKLRNILDRLC